MSLTHAQNEGQAEIKQSVEKESDGGRSEEETFTMGFLKKRVMGFDKEGGRNE